MFKKILVLFITLLLSGCIQQDVRIVLRSDGSGEYHIKKISSQIASAVIANIPAELREKTLTEQNEIQKEYSGGLKRTSCNVIPSPDNPSKFVETSVYSFSNLGEALPALEGLIDMGPRYSYRGDRFVIFRNREKEEWDGLSTSDEMKDAYLNFTIELPAEPVSSNGQVEGNVVKWKFNAEDLRKYQKMAIGENLIEVSIPASAIKTDLTPRLAEEKKKMKQEEEFQPLTFFSAQFPIVSDTANQKSVRATLQVMFPVNKFSLPISYKDLEIISLIVEGKEVKAELKSEPLSMFNGIDQWGQEVKGFPVNLEFPVSNPWLNKIDLLKIGLKVNATEKSHMTVFDIPVNGFPRHVLPNEPNLLLDKVAISKVNLGNPSVMLSAPGITLLMTTQPNAIGAFFLDTDYGLRYKAKNIKAILKKRSEIWDPALKKFVDDFFGDEEIYEYKIGFAKIPKSPFKLIIETIDQAEFQKHELILENIDVSP